MLIIAPLSLKEQKFNVSWVSAWLSSLQPPVRLPRYVSTHTCTHKHTLISQRRKFNSVMFSAKKKNGVAELCNNNVVRTHTCWCTHEKPQRLLVPGVIAVLCMCVCRYWNSLWSLQCQIHLNLIWTSGSTPCKSNSIRSQIIPASLIIIWQIVAFLCPVWY